MTDSAPDAGASPPEQHELSAIVSEIMYKIDQTDVMNAMANVEQQMLKFRDYLREQDEKDRPLIHWSKYKHYPALAYSTKRLNEVVLQLQKEFQKGAFEEQSITDSLCFSLHEVRGISITVSNVAIFAMEIMNRRTTMYIDLADDMASPIQSESEYTKNIVTKELKKVLKYSTEATGSVWSAIDLFEKISNSFKAAEPKQRAKWAWKQTLIFIVMLTVLGHLMYIYAIVPPGGHERLDIGNALLEQANLTTTLHITARDGITNLKQAMNTNHLIFQKEIDDIKQQVEHNRLVLQAEIDDLKMDVNATRATIQTDVEANILRIQRVEEATEANTARINDVWNALGPPNEHGTYYGNTGTYVLKGRVDKQIKELQKGVDATIERLRTDIKKAKDDWLRADIRLSGRIDKVERRK